MNDEGSWAVFSCNSGFWLHGPSMLYCKGHIWNSTKPVCKESDMMSSVSGVHIQKANIHLNHQAAVVLKTQQQSHYDTITNTASKEVNLKFGLLSHTPSQTSNSERVKVIDPKVHLQQHNQYPDSKIKDRVQTTHLKAQDADEAQRGTSTGPETGTGRHGSKEKASREEAEKVTQVTPTPVTQTASKSHLSASGSSTLSLVLRTTSTSSLSSLSTAHKSATVAVKQIPPTETVMFTPTSPLHHTKSALTVGVSVTSQDDVTPAGSSKSADEDQQATTDLPYPLSSPSGSEGEEEPTETSSTSSTSGYSVSTSSSFFTSSPPLTASSPQSSSITLPLFSASTSSSINFTLSNTKEILPSFNPPSHTSTPTEQKTHWTEYHNVTMNSSAKPPLSLSRRPVCPYPPVPAHGTFYFRNVENPGPREYRHYIQYACYPGYTLAHGDIHSYCQQGGTWSGVTPVCLELTPCSVNNGGCSQLCSNSQHYNQTSNQTQTRTQCHCRPGFTLVDDGRTCRDLDECVEGQHQCQQRCINTFGSFKCSCDDGYQPAHDRTSCTDVDECLLPAAVTGCVFGCVNTPGSFHCQCPTGYSLQTADGHCQDIDECAVNQGLGPCMEQCHNSPGSYRCSCTYGNILAGDGHSCIAECPPGYRKQPTTTPENSTSQALREECVDINECLEEKCEWQCVNLPGSHRCICPRGYTLQKDGRRCKDINECSRKNGGCSHLCLNQKGGYKCACPASHRLSPYSWKKCQLRTTVNTTG
ncbi:protein HEG [Thunnus maccoyii]|uniref:protein HEG n=1 Tax=Thunnus maccoyii TaxID=8240 RepID=UPI001C4D42FD|nr:protein HEG [Thunnus maccoyii]